MRLRHPFSTGGVSLTTDIPPPGPEPVEASMGILLPGEWDIIRERAAAPHRLQPRAP